MCYNDSRARSSSAPALAAYPASDCSKHMTRSQPRPRLRLEILTCDNGSIALDSVLVPWRVFDVDSRIGAPVAGGRRVFRWVSCKLLLEPDATSDVAEPGNPVSIFLGWYALGDCFPLLAQLLIGGQCYRDSEKFLGRIEITGFICTYRGMSPRAGTLSRLRLGDCFPPPCRVQCHDIKTREKKGIYVAKEESGKDRIAGR